MINDSFIPAIIQQRASIELPVQMEEDKKVAYEKWVHMETCFKKQKEISHLKKEMKAMLDERRNEDSRWVDVQERKKDIQSQLADIRKDELKVLSDLNQVMVKDVDMLAKLIADEKDQKSFFDRAALECAKDPVQVPLLIFNDEGFVSESVTGFSTKIGKQKRPRKKNRENAYTKAKFIEETFQTKK